MPLLDQSHPCCELAVYPHAAITGPVVYLVEPGDIFNVGGDLHCCSYCGWVYAVRRGYAIYQPEKLEPELASLRCAVCDRLVRENQLDYPHSYVGVDGKIYQTNMPLDMKGVNVVICKFPTLDHS